MQNTYLEVIIKKAKNNEPITAGERLIAWAYQKSKEEGFDFIKIDESIWEHDIESIVAVLRAASVNDLYITANTSNMLNIYLLFTDSGLKINDVVRLTNPQYQSDLERWGQSYLKPFIPAMKLSFEA